MIDAERTDLLETAPGHATRCVHSAFTDEFAAVKEDLAARGTPGREAWEQLERLNVGGCGWPARASNGSTAG